MKINPLSLCALIFCFVIFHHNYSKILIITTAYNRADFIKLQHETFQKLLKDDYEFKVFNDADNSKFQHEIEAMCTQLGIQCIRVPQKCHNIDPHAYKAPASFRHGESMQFAFENYGFDHDDIVCLLDSDVFLIRELSIRDFLGDNDLYILHGIMKPQLCFMNMPKLENPRSINWRAGVEDGNFGDAGSFTNKYIQAHPELKLLQGTMIWGLHRPTSWDLNLDKNQDIPTQLLARGYTNQEIIMIQSILDVCDAAIKANSQNTKVFMDCNIGFYETNLFLDYQHGSDWHGPNAAIKKQKDHIINTFFKSLLQ